MLSGIRVLIIEDEALIAATLAEAVLDAEGEVVGIASSVGEARRMIKQLTFDVAVLDLHLCDGEVTAVRRFEHMNGTTLRLSPLDRTSAWPRHWLAC